MKNIEILIDDEIIDYNVGIISIALTKQIQDFTDITTRTGDFSYSINIPMTPRNIRVFKHISNFENNFKFNKRKEYDIKVYSNSDLVIFGIFKCTQVTSTFITGYITSSIQGLFSLLGDKTLQDVTNLPEIEYEGVLLPVKREQDFYPKVEYNNGTTLNLNPSLCFDFLSLVKGYKDPNYGLVSSEIDYREWYTTNLIAYSNFYSTLSYPTGNYVTNNLSAENFKPNIFLEKVFDGIFNDIGYSYIYDKNSFKDIIIPYVGTEDIEWNWKHLSKLSANNKNKNIIFGSYKHSLVYGYIKRPLISARDRRIYVNNPEIPNPYPFEDRKFSYNIDNEAISQFTDNVNMRMQANVTVDNEKIECSHAVDWEDNFKVHYIPLGTLEQDSNNNYSFYDFPFVKDTDTRDSGQIYTAPADGKYEFDIENYHEISNSYWKRFGDNANLSAVNPFLELAGISNYMTDYEKQTLGNIVDGYDGTVNNKTWGYFSKEKFFADNMVVVVKVSDDDTTNENSDLLQSIMNTYREPEYHGFSSSNPNGTDRIGTNKLFKNIDNDNVIAFYHPMLRDLYNGGLEATWEEFIQSEKTLYKNDQAFPTNEDEKLDYFGFGKQTDILNFENNITSTFNTDPLTGVNLVDLPANFNNEQGIVPEAVQLTRRLVKTELGNKKFFEPEFFDYGASVKETFRHRSDANGIVKWKFNVELKKGEQIRMYYITCNQFRRNHQVNNYELGNTRQYGPMFQDTTGDYNQFGSSLTVYHDYFTDEIKVTKFNVKCVDEKYSDKLKLANFLPKIKQKDFLVDFIKTNNLYFDIKDKVITFKKRGEFFSIDSQKDLTNKTSLKNAIFTPLNNPKGLKFGYNSSDKDDYKTIIDKDNPITIIENNQNIYNQTEYTDITSTIFVSRKDSNYVLETFPIGYNNKFYFETGITVSFTLITLTSLNEDDSSLKKISESILSYDREPSLLNTMNYLNIEKLDGRQYPVFGINSLPFNELYKYIRNTEYNYTNSDLNSNFYDIFTNVQNEGSLLEVEMLLTDNDYSNLDLTKPITISNEIFYIQKIDSFEVNKENLTKVILLKLT